MNWKKIVEQVVTVVLSMVLTAFGGATVWAITTILQHERELATKSAKIMILEDELKRAQERDEKLLTLVAEEIKKIQDGTKPEEEKKEPMVWPIPRPTPIPPTPKKAPPKQGTEEYQRILRDKFRQRTEQMTIPNAPEKR